QGGGGEELAAGGVHGGTSGTRWQANRCEDTRRCRRRRAKNNRGEQGRPRVAGGGGSAAVECPATTDTLLPRACLEPSPDHRGRGRGCAGPAPSVVLLPPGPLPRTAA